MELNYTTQACIKSCYQRQLVEYCHCVDPSFVTRQLATKYYSSKNESIPDACQMGYTEGLKCVRKVIKNTTDSGVCEKQCPQACHEQDYTTRVTSSLWPRTSSFEKVADSWTDELPSLEVVRKAEKNRIDNLQMEVYFQELNYESVMESEAMNLWELLSSIGGTLGLYAGLSFLTLCEFIDVFISWCHARHQPQ